MPSPDASCRVGQAMYKLSAEHGDVLQREGGLAATLLYIDFFDLNTQRTAAATAANMCRNVAPEHLDAVAEVMPALSQLLCNGDQRIVESACLAFARLVRPSLPQERARRARDARHCRLLVVSWPRSSSRVARVWLRRDGGGGGLWGMARHAPGWRGMGEKREGGAWGAGGVVCGGRGGRGAAHGPRDAASPRRHPLPRRATGAPLRRLKTPPGRTGDMSAVWEQERGLMLSTATTTGVIKTLATACRASEGLALVLLEATPPPPPNINAPFRTPPPPAAPLPPRRRSPLSFVTWRGRGGRRGAWGWCTGSSRAPGSGAATTARPGRGRGAGLAGWRVGGCRWSRCCTRWGWPTSCCRPWGGRSGW